MNLDHYYVNKFFFQSFLEFLTNDELLAEFQTCLQLLPPNQA